MTPGIRGGKVVCLMAFVGGQVAGMLDDFTRQIEDRCERILSPALNPNPPPLSFQ
jgi:hypothetical protein